MKTAFVTVLLVLGAFAGPLPICSAKSPTPCVCPKGTDYTESSTFSIIGAEIADVEALLNDCTWSYQILRIAFGVAFVAFAIV